VSGRGSFATSLRALWPSRWPRVVFACKDARGISEDYPSSYGETVRAGWLFVLESALPIVLPLSLIWHTEAIFLPSAPKGPESRDHPTLSPFYYSRLRTSEISLQRPLADLRILNS
jgi:hypothetical protein